MTNNAKDRISHTDVSDRQRETKRETSLNAERVPLHEQNALTYFDMEPGYKYRWVNDLYGRINRFLKAGWVIVEGNVNSTYSGKGRTVEGQKSTQIWRVVNQRSDAPVKDAVLMKIPLEYFNEDQATKMERIDADEKSRDPDGVIRRAQMQGPLGNVRHGKK